MQMIIFPPSRWWRRQRVIQISYWPRWVAQWLCPHNEKNPIMWATDGSKRVTYTCVDCHKHITVVNDCKHPHVQVNAWIRNKDGGDVAKGWKCSACGMPLGSVPEGAVVEPPLAWSAVVGHDAK